MPETGVRILLCCPKGAGLSLMMESLTAKAARKVGLPVARLHHGSIREGAKTAGQFDLVLCPARLARQLDAWKGQVEVAGLKNPLSDEELEAALLHWMQTHTQS